MSDFDVRMPDGRRLAVTIAPRLTFDGRKPRSLAELERASVQNLARAVAPYN
jgi:hypothetical protein